MLGCHPQLLPPAPPPSQPAPYALSIATSTDDFCWHYSQGVQTELPAPPQPQAVQPVPLSHSCNAATQSDRAVTAVAQCDTVQHSTHSTETSDCIGAEHLAAFVDASRDGLASVQARTQSACLRVTRGIDRLNRRVAALGVYLPLQRRILSDRHAETVQQLTTQNAESARKIVELEQLVAELREAADCHSAESAELNAQMFSLQERFKEADTRAQQLRVNNVLLGDLVRLKESELQAARSKADTLERDQKKQADQRNSCCVDRGAQCDSGPSHTREPVNTQETKGPSVATEPNAVVAAANLERSPSCGGSKATSENGLLEPRKWLPHDTAAPLDRTTWAKGAPLLQTAATSHIRKKIQLECIRLLETYPD